MEVLFYCYFQKYTFLLGISRAKHLLRFPLLCKYVFVKNCYCYLSNYIGKVTVTVTNL